MPEPARVQHGAAAALAVLAVTVAAAAVVEGAPHGEVGGRGVRVRLRQVGRRGTRPAVPGPAPAPTTRTRSRQHAISTRVPHQSTPNAMSMSPIGIVTTCLPRLRNVIGLAKTRSPPLKCQSSLPVRASSA